MDPQGKSPKLVVHAVHGTWPFGLWAQVTGKRPARPGKEEIPWFRTGSSFERTILGIVKRPTKWVSFEWSGSNSFEARAQAADDLVSHLHKWFGSEPEAEHVVIAHSHGGSVAIRAASILDVSHQNRLLKIITLGTPFTRVFRSDRPNRELLARYFVMRFGWIAILSFVLSLMLVHEIADGRAGEPNFWLLIIHTHGLFLAVLGLPFILLLSKLGMVKFSVPAFPLPIITSARSWSLYAIRAPRDEAGVAISTAQLIDQLSDILFTRCLVVPFDWFRRKFVPDTIWGCIKLWLPWGVLFYLAVGAIDFFINGSISSTAGIWGGGIKQLVEAILMYSMAAVFGIPLFLSQVVVIAFAWVALLGAVLLFPANVILALAVGREVFSYRGLLEIECEPTPSGIDANLLMIRLSSSERSGLGLVHFIHGTEGARTRVAEILTDD